jgi:hypothetical protein
VIVYHNHHLSVPPSESIQRIFGLISALKSGNTAYQNAVSLLIECGELETGITDALSGRVDCACEEVDYCREVSVISGKIVCQMWETGKIEIGKLIRIEELLNKLKSDTLPGNIPLRIPEGFVYYGLYPETYIQAADIFISEVTPESVVVVGIRTIGTQLSALVAARLEKYCCKVDSFTVRPKGHPFSRYIEFSEQQKQKFVVNSSAWVVVVDEGPGLSGSTICGTLLKIKECGVLRDRTVVFPSWIPDGKLFISANARSMWNHYKKYLGCFDEMWIRNGRLEKQFDKSIYREISCGMWRPYIIKNEDMFPAVHPNHERRKYILCKYGGKSLTLTKFAGLGRYGETIVKRGSLLARAGFTPMLNSFSDGFVDMDFIEGELVTSGGPDNRLLETVARYCSFLRKNCKAESVTTFSLIMDMIRVNVGEGLGPQWLRKIDLFEKKYQASIYENEVVSIDGRMFPHKWIRTDSGYVKVDHLEHHADEFFHGPQNIAWDLAGFSVEFELAKNKRDTLVELYIHYSNDRSVIERLPFFIIAYLSFRLGYVTLASQSLQGQADALRFDALIMKYRKNLIMALGDY